MKIFLLDDYKIFGQSIKLLLEEQDEIELCDYTSSIGEFFRAFKSKAYDILLIDINLKGAKTGFDIVKEVFIKKPNQKVAILTSYDLANYRDMAYKLGVEDFINKSVEIEELIQRLENIYRGKYKNITSSIKDPLTEREIEVLKELVKGDNKKEIAKKLFISERTLYNHISNIYDKLGVKNLVEAYNKAMEIGYIDPVM